MNTIATAAVYAAAGFLATHALWTAVVLLIHRRRTP